MCGNQAPIARQICFNRIDSPESVRRAFFCLVFTSASTLVSHMDWHYELSGQQLGPVSDSELKEMFRIGKIKADNLVWHEGMKDWQPFAVACPEIPPRLSANQTTTVCVECGKTFPPDELVTLNRSLVCAQCKPIFLQRLAEGAPISVGAGIWREGKKLVTCSETPFPDRCVKCNASANGFRLKRVLYWQNPAYYLLLLINVRILLIVVLIVRKKAILNVGLCEAHRQQRLTAIAVCWSGVLAGPAAIIAGAIYHSAPAIAGGIVIFLAALIWGLVKGRTISASKIDKENVWVSGVCRAFLEELPER